MRKFVALLAGLILSSSAFAQSVTIQNAYIRAVPSSSEVTAAFMQITNNSTKNLALVSASSPAAKAVELHTHTHVGGVMQMRQIDTIELASTSTTELHPGGLHLMLIGLTKPVVAGQTALITLRLNNGEMIELEVPIKKATGQETNHAEHLHQGQHQQHKQHHNHQQKPNQMPHDSNQKHTNQKHTNQKHTNQHHTNH